MKPKPFEIIVELTPQCTKTGITYEMHQKSSLIRCKDCKNYSGDGMYCGWNMIARADGYCFHANEDPEYADD